MIDLNQAFAGMNVEESSRVRWTLPVSLPYFDGHFPENPIFPAVGMVDASLHALAKILGRNVDLASIPTAKFTSILKPGIPVVLAFEKDEDDSWSVEWTMAETEKSVASLTLKLYAETV